MSNSRAAYRPDIDGLRALAVLPVVAFHLGIERVPGGFVGVDVFFVISGYLIARLIFTDIDKGLFTIAGFYARRIRRLFPALFVMLATIAVVSWAVLYPVFYVDFGRSVVAASASLSNFYFWSTTNYFEAPIETKPLVHTWSLAVEEQFYLVFPLAAALSFRYGRKLARILFTLLFLVSFAASAVVTFTHEESAFYLPHLRAWELLLGVLLALGVRPKFSREWARTAAAVAGCIGIVAPVFLYTSATPFPGMAALAPCMGTALVIAAGEDGRHGLTSLLSWKPAVFVGLISYSLYLWHWPIITLYQQYTGDLDRTAKILLALTSFVVAILSWRFIELPFRTSRPAITPSLAAGGGLVATGLAAGLFIVAQQGFPSRFDPEVVRIASYMTEERPESDPNCFLRASQNEPFSSFDVRCLRLDRQRQNVLVFGDSHAEHLVDGLRHVMADANVMQATASQCAPVREHDPLEPSGCVDLVDYVYANLLPNADIDLVVISARWNQYDISRIDRAFTALEPYRQRIVVVGPAVQYKAAVPQLLAIGMRTHDPGFADRNLDEDVASTDASMRAVALKHGIPYLSAYAAFCPRGDCDQLSPERVPYQYDYGHLTFEGSVFMASRIMAAHSGSDAEPGQYSLEVARHHGP